eukprot:155459-Rhodomonas_salina.1
MEKKGTPASPATARARSVFPVPGGPSRMRPRGIRAPSSVKRCDCGKRMGRGNTWSNRRKTTAKVQQQEVCSTVRFTGKNTSHVIGK